MPTYEYIREDGTRFEMIQKFSDASLTACPDSGLTCKRIISGGSGVIYKGSGWYITDYKNAKNGSTSTPSSQQNKSSEPAVAPESKSETKSESGTNPVPTKP